MLSLEAWHFESSGWSWLCAAVMLYYPRFQDPLYCRIGSEAWTWKWGLGYVAKKDDVFPPILPLSVSGHAIALHTRNHFSFISQFLLTHTSIFLSFYPIAFHVAPKTFTNPPLIKTTQKEKGKIQEEAAVDCLNPNTTVPPRGPQCYCSLWSSVLFSLIFHASTQPAWR